MSVHSDNFINKPKNISRVGQCNILSENLIVIDDTFICLYIQLLNFLA